MKIIDPNTYTMTPQAQMWFGVSIVLLSSVVGILTVTHPMVTLDRIQAFIAFSGVPLWAWVAWHGYRRQSKADSSK